MLPSSSLGAVFVFSFFVSFSAIGVFYVGHISAGYTQDTILASIVSGSKRWITNRMYRGLIAACALFFFYLGGVFILQGIRVLTN